MNPDVGRIHVDEDGHVAQDANRAARGGRAQVVPLQGEGELQHLLLGQRAAVLLRLPGPAPSARGGAAAPATRSMRRWRTGGAARRRARSRPARRPQRGKTPQTAPTARRAWVVRPAVEKVARRFVEQRQLAPLHLFKIHSAAAAGQAGDALAVDPAPVGEKFKADEEGIAGKGRGARIGRVAVAGGAERQNLPDVLFGRGEKGHKLMGGRPQVADAAVGGQRADVQQNSGGTLKFHVSIIAEEQSESMHSPASATIIRVSGSQRPQDLSEKPEGNPLQIVSAASCFQRGIAISLLAPRRRFAAEKPALPPAHGRSAPAGSCRTRPRSPQSGAEVSSPRFNTGGLVHGHGSGHGADHAGEQPRLSRAALWREQPPGDDSREPGAHSYWYRTALISEGLGPADLAQLRRHQLLGSGVGERRAGGNDARRIHPRHLRYYSACEAGQEGRGGGAGRAAAASRRSA